MVDVGRWSPLEVVFSSGLTVIRSSLKNPQNILVKINFSNRFFLGMLKV